MRGQTTGGRRAGVVAVLAVAGLMLVAVLAVWAASIGRDAVLSGDGPERIQIDTPTPTPSVEANQAPGPPPGDREPSDPPAFLGALAVVVVALFWLLLVAGVFLALRGLWRQARLVRAEPEPAPVEMDVLAQPARVSEQMVRDASIQRALLDEGAPRTAIEACWQRFEVQAREAGLPRKPWETSSEFTYRMLDLVGADPHAALTLGELYREARFSEHPLGEEARSAARAALASIQLSPRARREQS